jgi:hypothetical protein
LIVCEEGLRGVREVDDGAERFGLRHFAVFFCIEDSRFVSDILYQSWSVLVDFAIIFGGAVTLSGAAPS